MRTKSIITSINNTQIKNLALLQKKAKTRQEQGVFVVEGLKMFEEAKKEGVLMKGFASESFYRQKIAEDEVFFTGFDYEIIADHVFRETADTKTPQGIMGIVSQADYSPETMFDTPKACVLILEDIRDPGNLGTMIRTAEGAGITGIIFNKTCVDIYNPKVIRSTMGSIYRMPFYQTKNLLDTLIEMKKRGFILFAAHLKGQPYDMEGSFLKKCAIMIGNEANGLRSQTSEQANQLLRIPMSGRVESLNAAVAAAILMYEAARQRNK